jgi:hypothetical protein
MTNFAQKKAKQLVELFWTEVEDNNYATRKMSLIQAKQCALITVDEIIKTNPYEWDGEDMNSTIDYWEEVKQEIEKL